MCVNVKDMDLVDRNEGTAVREVRKKEISGSSDRQYQDEIGQYPDPVK